MLSAMGSEEDVRRHAKKSAACSPGTRCGRGGSRFGVDGAVLTGLGFALVLLGGCPEPLEPPPPGPSPACEVIADCNEGRTCGGEPLFVCVDSRCETTPSLVRPCVGDADGGT